MSALVVAATAFAVNAGQSALAKPLPGAPPAGSVANSLLWRAGPAPLVYPPSVLVRLGADRVLAYGSAVARCTGISYCVPNRDTNPAVAIWDIAHGTSTRVADPPTGEQFGGGDGGPSAAVLGGEVYFDGASTVHSPDQAVHRTYNVVRYSSGANRWDLLPTPDGIGSALLNYNWTLAAGRPTLVRDWFDPTRPQPDGAVLAPDGNWHLIPADPFARDKNRPFLVVVGSQLVALHGSDRTTQVAGLTMSAQGPVGHWRKLTSIRHAKPFGVHPASVDGYLVWRDLVYDPRTGRPVPTPIVLQNRPERDAEQVTGAEVPDGVVFGDRVTFSGALFDPRSGTWTDIPTPPDHETSTAKPLQPGAHRLDFAYAYLGGPEDVVRFRRGELVTTGSDSGPVTMTAESGQVDVLREAS